MQNLLNSRRPFASVFTVFVGALLVLTPGCRTSEALFLPERSQDMGEAGSVHLAVLAVAPWSEYVNELKPDFTISGDEAYKKVTRDTRWQNQDTFRAAGAGQQTTVLERSTNEPLLAPGINVPPRYIDGPQDNGQGYPSDSNSENEVGPDAMTKYSAAAALFQEVKLLNRYIGDAAIPDGFRPYMVRLQVSLMPSRRHAPYDAYTTLSFFTPEDGERASFPLPLDDLLPSAAVGEPFGNGPKVLPLLVTDNLEASVQSRSLDRMWALLFSSVSFTGLDFDEPMLSGMLHSAIRDQVYGRDLNSLLTVARLSENTLRIRLGAAQEATSNYAMVPRNHNVTLLLMVPEGASPLMEVVSKTVLVDTESGAELKSSHDDYTSEALEAFQEEWRLEKLPAKTIDRLHELAQDNDQDSFTDLLHTSVPPNHSALQHRHSIWIELVSMATENRFSSNLFELPGQGENPEDSSEVFANQTVVVEDDGTYSTVTLREARFPEFEQILAVLTIKEADPAIVLPAESVEIDLARRELHVRFPSLERWQLVPPDLDPVTLGLELSWANEERSFGARLVSVSNNN